MTAALIPAATVILVRPHIRSQSFGDYGPSPSKRAFKSETESDFETLMMRRSHAASFAANAFVFPGGRVEQADSSLLAAQLDPLEEDDLSVYRRAAIRETFEECGVLLDQHMASSVSAAWLQDARRDVANGASFYELVQEAGLVLGTPNLVHFAHWIPPDYIPKRFNTHFFVHALPVMQEAMHDDVEITECRWLTPQAAIEQFHADMFPMIYPTARNMERLAAQASLAACVKHAQDTPVRPVCPSPVEVDGVTMFEIPDGLGYPVIRHSVADMRRS